MSRTYGERYDGDLDVAEIAKLVRKDIKAALAAGELPSGLKTSVRISRYSMGRSLDVRVTVYPGAVVNPAYAAWRVEHPHDPHFDAPSRFTEEATAHLEVLKSIHRAYNHDGSDLMSDYYDVNYYGQVEFDSSLEYAERERLEAEYVATKAALESEGSAIVEEALAEDRELNEADLDRLVAVVAEDADEEPNVVVLATYRHVDAEEPTAEPDEEFDPVVVVRVGDPPVTASVKECPKCGASADADSIELLFGFRKLRGNVVPQSWCRCCRREAARAGRATS